MFFLTNIVNFILFSNLIWLIGDTFIKGDDDSEDVDISEASIVLSKPRNKNFKFLVIFNPDYVLWPFEIKNASFPIWELESGEFVDDYNKTYRPYDGVTNVLKDLKERGFRLGLLFYAPVQRRSQRLINFEEEVITIFDWTPLFKDYIYYAREIREGIEKIHNVTRIPFKNMIYFDDNNKYDNEIVDRFHIFRWIVKNGITNETVKEAFANYSKTLGEDAFVFE